MIYHVTFWLIVGIWGFVGLVHYCVHEQIHDYNVRHNVQKFVWTLIHGPLTWMSMVVVWLVIMAAHLSAKVEQTNTFLKFKAWLNKP